MVDLAKVFGERFGGTDGAVGFRAPGRVNLIGEHTDYNDGFVFPAAVSLEIRALARPRSDTLVRVWSEDFREAAEWDLKDLTRSGPSWTAYIKAVIAEMPGLVRGFEAVYASDLPVGGGLSSSAAFELLNCLMLSEFNGRVYEPREAALLCQRAENRYVGVRCGVMDQFAVALGRKGAALFLDTRTLEHRTVRLAEGVRLVVADTRKPRALAASAYNTRRSECEAAVEALRRRFPEVRALRDATVDMLRACEGLMAPVVFRRALHVVEENLRVLESVKALEGGDLGRFGRLMDASHESLRDLYEVSCVELDILVEEARRVEGCLGSRMTGAGFGGCTVSLVRADAVEEFVRRVGPAYRNRTGLEAVLYVVEAVDGASMFP